MESRVYTVFFEKDFHSFILSVSLFMGLLRLEAARMSEVGRERCEKWDIQQAALRQVQTQKSLTG